MTTSFRIGDILERAWNQGVQTLIGALPASLGVIGTSGALETAKGAAATGKAAVAAGLTAAIATFLSLIKNAVASNRHLTSSGNVVRRLVWTVVFAFIAALPAGEVYLDLPFAETALLGAISAAVAAAVSFAKNLTAEGVVVEAARRTGQIASDPIP